MARRKRGNFLNKQAPLSIGQRTRRILIWTGAVLGGLLLLCIAGYMYLISWVQGESCRTYLAAQLQQLTAAEQVSIPENLTVDGKHMTLPACTLRGAKGIQELSIRKLHLEVDRLALLRRMLHLNHFSVEELQIALQLAGAGSTEAPSPQASATVSSGGVFLRDFRARSFESHYTDTSITAGGRKFSLNGYQLVALPRPELGKNAWAIGIENGRIRTPFTWLRESGVKNATLLYSGNDVQLSDCKIELAPGHLSARGVYQPGSGLWKAHVDVKQANVARLLNDDWSKRLLGELWGQLDLSGEATKATWEATGELHLKKGVLEGLPFLSDLQLNGTTPYRTLHLEKASCQLSYPYSEPEHGLQNAWLWDKIDVRAKGGELLLRGRVITGVDGKLAGALSVGVPAKLISDLGLNKTPIVSKLFNAPVELPGYVWLRINLSGTVAAPQEDLSVRLATILPEALPVLAEKAMGSLGSVIGTLLPGTATSKSRHKQHNEKTAEGDTDSQPDEEPQKQPRPSHADKVRGIINTGLDMLF